MVFKKTIIRIFVWSTTLTLVAFSLFLLYFADLNKLKSLIEKNLKNQLNCTIVLGTLEWDLDGLNVGVSTSEITLYDKNNDLIFQAGQSRAVWNLFYILLGRYTHFRGVEATNLYFNAIRNKEGKWNLFEIFPPGPEPEADNINLNNSIIYLVDEYLPVKKSILYKDLNITSKKNFFSKLRIINLTTRVGSLTSPSFLRLKGQYTESKKFNWRKNEVNLFLKGKDLQLENWEPYLTEWPQINKISGEFTGTIVLKKESGMPYIKVKSKSETKNLFLELKNNEATQAIRIPTTEFRLQATIDKKKIKIKSFRSSIDQLVYKIRGQITDWSSFIPNIDVQFKTNKFNFKSVKPYLPLSLLPADTRSRIEPINDDGNVELDLSLKGVAIAPKYFGMVTLSDFNLSPESGFFNFIQGLNGKLTLDDQILKIDELNIPLKDSVLVLKGEVNNEDLSTVFNLKGDNLDLHLLQDLILQMEPNASILNEVDTYGKLGLDLNVTSKLNTAPEIKGTIKFHDSGISVFKGEPVKVQNAFGELILDGSKVSFNKLTGLINNEPFYINGDFSLKEDEIINLSVFAKHLKIIPNVISFLTAKTPIKPLAESISGEINDVNLDIKGTLFSPTIFGGLTLNNISFKLPNLDQSINNISGKFRFEGTELVIEELNGYLDQTAFGIAGYLDDLFTQPSPRFRLVTDVLDISKLWDYIKERLKATPINAEAEKIKDLKALVVLDLFLRGDIITGNVYFKDTEIDHTLVPFKLNNLSGRVVLGENNISLFNVNGSLNNSNNFNCNITVYDYTTKTPNIKGQIKLDLDPASLLESLNPNLAKTITTDGLIPTSANFDVSYPKAKLSFYSTLDEMLMLDVAPYISKPTNLSYTITGFVDADLENFNVDLENLNVTTDDLSFTTMGNITNLSSENPEFMLDFQTDGPTRTYMLIKPFVPIRDLRVFGDVDFAGSFSGTLSMYAISSKAKLTNIKIQPPFKEDTRISFDEGTVEFYLDDEKGFLNSNTKEVDYLSFHAKSVGLFADYKKPVINLKEFIVDGDPGDVKASGSYNLNNGELVIMANGSMIELSKLGSFILLDPSNLAGMTSFSIDLKTTGKTKEESIANSNGSLVFSTINGHIGEIALLHKGLQFANLLGQGIFGLNIRNVFSLFFNYQGGDFNTIDGNVKIKNGVVKAKGFHYRADNLFLNALGAIDLVKSYIQLKFYGYLPKTAQTSTMTTKGALTILPKTLEKHRIIIPFISSTPPEHFRFELKGDMKNQKKLMRRTTRSFKWLRGRRLKKEWKYVPKPEGRQ